MTVCGTREDLRMIIQRSHPLDAGMRRINPIWTVYGRIMVHRIPHRVTVIIRKYDFTIDGTGPKLPITGIITSEIATIHDR